jgi:hypothetical protein
MRRAAAVDVVRRRRRSHVKSYGAKHSHERRDVGVQVQVLQYCNCLGETRGVSSSLVTGAALGFSSSLGFGSGINISRNLCFLNQSCLNNRFCLSSSPGFISVAG